MSGPADPIVPAWNGPPLLPLPAARGRVPPRPLGFERGTALVGPRQAAAFLQPLVLPWRLPWRPPGQQQLQTRTLGAWQRGLPDHPGPRSLDGIGPPRLRSPTPLAPGTCSALPAHRGGCLCGATRPPATEIRRARAAPAPAAGSKRTCNSDCFCSPAQPAQCPKSAWSPCRRPPGRLPQRLLGNLCRSRLASTSASRDRQDGAADPACATLLPPHP
mmetsp:Transcript_24550/g.54664  ORF Transcript_24550/g.54664 Transcript_24550/m.54664 type:complete len:217 (-) Transcript_24550:2478-3128(-)